MKKFIWNNKWTILSILIILVSTILMLVLDCKVIGIFLLCYIFLLGVKYVMSGGI